MIVAVAALGLAAIAAIVAAGAWLRSEIQDNKRQTRRADTAESDLAHEQREHDVTRKRLEQEQEQRTIAVQRAERAESRLDELFPAHLKDASDDEIRAHLAAVFVAPRMPSAVPRSQDGADALIDPDQ